MTIPGASCFRFAHSASLVEFWFIPSDQTQETVYIKFLFLHGGMATCEKACDLQWPSEHSLMSSDHWALSSTATLLLQNPLLSLPVSRSLLSIASPTWLLQSSFTCCRHHKTEVTPRYFYSICLLLFSMTPLWLRLLWKQLILLNGVASTVCMCRRGMGKHSEGYSWGVGGCEAVFISLCPSLL